MMKSEIFLEVKVVGNLWVSHNMYKKVKIRICCSSFLFFGIKFVKKSLYLARVEAFYRQNYGIFLEPHFDFEELGKLDPVRA